MVNEIPQAANRVVGGVGRAVGVGVRIVGAELLQIGLASVWRQFGRVRKRSVACQ